jgi:hypothetical protein
MSCQVAAQNAVVETSEHTQAIDCIEIQKLQRVAEQCFASFRFMSTQLGKTSDYGM